MLRRLIEKPIAVTMTLIAIVVLGAVAVNMLPVSLMPDVPIPNITVQVSAPGQSARQVNSVIGSLRRQLMQIGHLKEIVCESEDDGGTIFLQFEYGADTDFLFIEVNERIDRAMNSLLRDLERPRVIKASATDIPAFYLNVTLREPMGETDIVSNRFMEMSSLVTQVITKRIEQIPYVAMVDVSGTVYPEIFIAPKAEKMEALGIGLSEVERAIANNNINLGNLSVRDGEYQYSIRFDNSLTGKQDIENLFLKIHERLYQLSELVDVVEQPQPRKGSIRSNGQDAITLAVIKQSDARMKDLKQEVSKLLNVMQQDYPDVVFELTRDQTELLEYSISNMKSNMIWAAVLACLIIFIFMADFRSPALVVITIPLSLIVSLFFFHLIGISLNVISISGLILGLGMMVDNSIIVIDNITQYWKRGLPLRDSIVKGTSEVFAPMLSSVLTTVSIFVPLVFLSGIAGALFYDQAVGVSIGLLSSLTVAVLVIPVYFLLFYKKCSTPPENRYLARIDISSKMIGLYEKILKASFRNRGVMWLGFVAIIFATWPVYKTIDKERFPPITHNDILFFVDWNDMISVEENGRRVSGLMEGIHSLTAQSTWIMGTQEFMLSHTPALSPSQAIVYIRGNTPSDIPKIEERLSVTLHNTYPEANHWFQASGNIFDMIFAKSEAPLVAQLRQKDGEAPSPDKLNTVLSRLAEEIPHISFEPVLWNEHLLLVADPERMTLYNVNYSTLLSVLRNALNQNHLFTISNGSIPLPVVSGLNRSITDILQESVLSRDSVDIPLRNLMIETRSRDLKSIISGSQGSYYPLHIWDGADNVPELMEQIRGVLKQDTLYEVDFNGSYFSNREMIKELVIVLLVALLLLYFILAAQFESIVQPLIILCEVVVDICGALVVLLIFGASINLMSLIGMVVMCGIVINDSILKVDTINHLRKEGYSLLRAIMMGGVRRIKPIVMTALTTILALVPFLRRGNMGADLEYPLSLALIGGMILGTLVSIFFIPLVYYQIYKPKSNVERGK